VGRTPRWREPHSPDRVADGIVRDETGRVEYHNAIVDFLANAPDGEPACADDAMDVRWVGPDDVEGMALTPSMWPLIEKLFGRSYRRA
jgi:hypothetical protein